MKHLKIYETISKPYKVGDYAIVKISSRGILYEDILVKLTEINNLKNGDITIKILNHFDVFDSIKYKYIILPYQIICWSENKKELELLIDTKKYNI